MRLSQLDCRAAVSVATELVQRVLKAKAAALQTSVTQSRRGSRGGRVGRRVL